ncbi:MAG: hypothetical protein IKF99_06220 [Oscillospiraceae bacterium]|nr:hypothetical protein [Oscillospiraceae bacterium]
MSECIERDKLPCELSADGMDDNAVIFASGYNTCLEEVKSIPAADVRPVLRGRWVPDGLDDAYEGMFKCSICGSLHYFPEILLGIRADNFCCNCGADMRGKG